MKVFSKLMLVAMMMAASITTQAQELYVGSYNIRYQNDGDAKAGNAWQQRMPVLCGQILFEHPDIFGAQEVLESQRQDLLKQLTDYDCIGLGRDDGKHAGEHSNIFYDRNIALQAAKQVVRQELEKDGKQLHKELDEIWGVK